jgi:hypothetical protein
MVLSALTNVACVMKAELINNQLWSSAGLAGYLRNDDFIGGVTRAVGS